METFTFFVAGGEKIHVPRAPLIEHSAYFRKLIEEDPTCHLLEFRNASYESAEAVVNIVAYLDDTFFWEIIISSRRYRKKGIRRGDATADSFLRRLLSLLELCHSVELYWYGALCAKELAEHIVTPAAVMKVLPLCLRWESSDPTEGTAHLLRACLVRVPSKWEGPSEERAWRDLCRRYPSLQADRTALNANKTPQKGRRENTRPQSLPSHETSIAVSDHSPSLREREDRSEEELVRQLEEELRAQAARQATALREAHERGVSNLKDVTETGKSEIAALQQEVHALERQLEEEQSLYTTYNREADTLDSAKQQARAYRLALQAAEEELRQIKWDSRTVEGLERHLDSLIGSTEGKCQELEAAIADALESKRSILQETDGVTQRLDAWNDVV
ncbi:hypothetical protein ADEAN_000990200 [Angomonas deanei]|uniref:Uncharacterized protein n=1 Tax=Angomonas deanei TaxID=59799 RepID=A0A7G2CRB1_9TRYP|nr:hypothetical protein ADEAN_000990200 [Angomonas deanei]